MNNQIKYIIYARKSSEDEDRQIASIDDQIRTLKTKAIDMGLNVVKVFQEAKSAKAPGRPIFNEMLEMIKAGKVGGVICWKLDRLARNPVDGGEISWMLQQSNIKHIQTYERSYWPKDNVLLMAVELGMANQYVRDLSDNVKRGLKNKLEMGWFPERAPLGYLNSINKERGENDIDIDPERFVLVRKLWDLMLTGNYTVKQVWRIADKELHLKTRPTKRHPSKPLSLSGAYTLFTKLFYTGSFEYPRGTVYEGKHQPMITLEEYNRVQELLGKRGQPRPQKHSFPFTGIMRCECGSMITAEEKTKQQKNGNVHHYVYYRCAKKKGECKEKYISAVEADKQIAQLLSQITISEDFQKWSLKHLHEVRKKEAQTEYQVIQNKQREYEGVIKQLQNLMLTFTSPDNAGHKLMTPAELTELKSGLQLKKTTLEHELKKEGQNVNDWVELTEKTFNFARYASTWFAKGDINTRKAIFAAIGSDFVLKDQKLRVELKKPFAIISQGVSTLNEQKVLARTSETVSGQTKNTTLDGDVFCWLSSRVTVTPFKGFLAALERYAHALGSWVCDNPIAVFAVK